MTAKFDLVLSTLPTSWFALHVALGLDPPKVNSAEHRPQYYDLRPGMKTDRYKDVSWVRLGDLSAQYGTKSASEFFKAVMYGSSGLEYAADAKVHALSLKVQTAARRALMAASVPYVVREPLQTATGGLASRSTSALCDEIKEIIGVLANRAEDHHDADVGAQEDEVAAGHKNFAGRGRRALGHCGG